MTPNGIREIVSMPPPDYKLAIALIPLCGFLLLYAFQLGFFAIVGLQYAGLTAILDFWTNAKLALTYGIPTAAAFLLF